jgi:hypothetical protein
MKRSYTQMSYVTSKALKIAKRFCPNYSREDYVFGLFTSLLNSDNIIESYCQYIEANNIDERSVSVKKYVDLTSDVLISAYSELCAIDNGSINLFLTDMDFCNWIVSCVKDYSDEHLEFIYDHFSGKDICFNFPTGNKICSFLVRIIPPIKSDRIEIEEGFGSILKSYPDGKMSNVENINRFNTLFGTGGKCRFIITFSTNNNGGYEESFFVDPLCEKSKMDLRSNIFSEIPSDENGSWFVRFIIGIGMYMSALPEQVKDGIPEDLKHPSHYKHIISKTITMSEKYIDRSGPCPHFRRGHFRVLRSERFKNKRWQVIFIEAMCIKGYKAKTVVSIDNPVEVIDV